MKCGCNEPAEPEFTVGQTVSGDDYARLPVRSVVESLGGIATKVGDNAWRWDDGEVDANEDVRAERTLTHLGDGLAEWERELLDAAEDKADLYVEQTGLPGPLARNMAAMASEPEPLKEGDAVLVWAKVITADPDFEGEVNVELQRAARNYGDTYTLPDAIVRPAEGQTPPWVKAIEEPLNIGAVVADRDDAVWARVATGDPGGPWWTRASEGPEESMTYPHHWGDLSVREVLSEGHGGAS